jgi:hypothetical protein
MKQFNINATVKVRLTKFGKQLHKQQWEGFWKSIGRLDENPYTPPKEDDNGYVEFQMWDLMEKFGNHCGLCKELAFDTIILIYDKDLRKIPSSIKPKKAVIEVDCPIDDFFYEWENDGDKTGIDPTQADYDRWAFEKARKILEFDVTHGYGLSEHIELK